MKYTHDVFVRYNSTYLKGYLYVYKSALLQQLQRAHLNIVKQHKILGSLFDY